MNTFGRKLTLTTFGESHGVAIGGVLDGFPAGIGIDLDFVQAELDKRKPGSSKFATARSESDRIEILSGVFDGVSTGVSIGFIIRNENQKSNDYENLRELFRPGHADYTYFKKYGIRDHRGGGRSSARETAVRVAAGAIAQILLDEFGISVRSGVSGVGSVMSDGLNFDLAASSEIFSLGKEDEMKSEILKAKQTHDSVGASVITQILGVRAGLGEGLYYKLDAQIAAAFMGINGVKAVEIGEGVKVSQMLGSQNNDNMRKNGFVSNNAGGILGGMSSGEMIQIKTHFKPTPSIFAPQNTINKNGDEVICELRGRHDPCIGVRGSVVTTAMARLVIADMLLLNSTANLQNLKQIYH